LVVFLILLVKPDFLGRPIISVVATIPSHNFLVVILAGAGSGFLMFALALLVMNCLGVEWFSSWWIGFAVPDAASSIATGSVTSLICTLLRLKDVASALYFAPLIFPAVTLAIVFSVQWIPICVGSCLAMPMKAIFVYVVTAVFVKLPVNLFAGLTTGSAITSPPYHTLRSIHTRRLIGSRRIFLSAANCLLFFLIWPLVKQFADAHIDFQEWKLFVPYIPLWVLASVCIGIASLGLADAVDWALFAFVSAAGSGLVVWIVLFVHAVCVEKMRGTLQLSMHTAVTALICIGLSLSAGSISVVAAVLWIIATGVTSKSS
jgi:hypothetical protein